jgi:transposase-like protein
LRLRPFTRCMRRSHELRRGHCHSEQGGDPDEVPRGYRFPEEIISQCVWLYFNFAVSLREVELMMAHRGVDLRYETIRRWCDIFGAFQCNQTEAEAAQAGDNWFLDEVFSKINGAQHYLWGTVDQHGAAIDILVQPKRDRLAAKRFFPGLTPPHSFRIPDSKIKMAL